MLPPLLQPVLEITQHPCCVLYWLKLPQVHPDPREESDSIEEQKVMVLRSMETKDIAVAMSGKYHLPSWLSEVSGGGKGLESSLPPLALPLLPFMGSTPYTQNKNSSIATDFLTHLERLCSIPSIQFPNHSGSWPRAKQTQKQKHFLLHVQVLWKRNNAVDRNSFS